MPELEAYRLDCAQSNVSPDSGIQSVPGSPVNESTQRDSTPPVLRPVTPPERNVRKRGRPKKFRNGLVKIKDEDSKLVKRGPGRPKKVVVPHLLGHDSSNLNFMLNEICERVNRGLELPSKGGSRAIEIKELERIISDHKTSKARNSKIDALFSKSKKLSSVPNIAIVKPMQHHILNEKKDDDEKQNKRGGRRCKLDKFEELQVKSEGKDGDDKLEKPNKERRKSERDRKIVKPVLPVKAAARPNRSRTRNLSSGTDGSCDKSVDLEVKKTKIEKVSKKTTIKIGSNGVKAPCVNYVQPMPRKVVQKTRPKYLSVRHSLLHHRHKRKKSKKNKAAEKTRLDYAWFKMELEKIINDFQKCYIDGKKNLPTAPVAPTTKIVPPASPVQEKVSKRIGKKRKIDKNDKKETTVEKLKASEVVSEEKEKPKRKQKKGHNEVHGQAEANPNEQRLPLKKRHYHLTSDSQSDEGKEKETMPKESPSPSKKEETPETQRILRSSVEDTIEATISRFSNLETGQCSVIVTPKKRHRPEDDESKSSDVISEGVIKTAHQRRSRSSSLNKEKDRKAKGKKSDKVLRSVKKLIDADDPSKTEPLHIDLPLLEAVKVECPNSDSLEMATLTPITEIKQESKAAKLPVAGIFEPSDNAVEIDNSILVPLNSPSEMVNDLKGSLSLKAFKSDSVLKMDSKSRKIDRNQKAIENMKTVRVNLDALTSSELLINGVQVGRKVRRRKVINRTGFPSSKKKKKKKLVEDVKTVIIDEAKAVACENSNLSDKPLSEFQKTNSPTETDDEVPLKSVQKISAKIEEKLNAGRILKKRKIVNPEPKKTKIERVLRQKEEPVLESKPVVPVKAVRKRKLTNTIKNTKSKMKIRYQLPLLSMKKFKKAKFEEKPVSEDEAEVVEAKKKMQPRWRKKYLPAGLLSDYYKVDYKDKPPPKAPEKSFNKLVYNPEEHEHGLLPPPAYCNKFLRLRREDFLLPYDIWWLHSNNQLPSRGDVPSWNYKKIRTSKFFFVIFIST